MDLKKIGKKYYIALFIIYIATAISTLLGLYISIVRNFPLFLSIYLIPLTYISIKNIDLEEHSLLDEYLFLILSSIFFSFFFADLRNFYNFLLTTNLTSYLLINCNYVIIVGLLNKIFNDLFKIKNKE